MEMAESAFIGNRGGTCTNESPDGLLFHIGLFL